MKKIIILLVMLAVAPSLVLAGNPAPYTEEALQKINKAISDTPREQNNGTVSKEEFHHSIVEYFTRTFENVGYSFSDTIDQIVDDMRNNPAAIPTDRETVYNKIYVLLNIMMYQCEHDQIDCLQFFPPNTQQSIQWFMENSNFSKENKDAHYPGH